MLYSISLFESRDWRMSIRLKESILQVRTVCAKTIHKRKYALRNRMEACVAEGRGAVWCEM